MTGKMSQSHAHLHIINRSSHTCRVELGLRARWSTSTLCAREVGASGGGGVADKTKLYHGELIQLV